MSHCFDDSTLSEIAHLEKWPTALLGKQPLIAVSIIARYVVATRSFSDLVAWRAAARIIARTGRPGRQLDYGDPDGQAEIAVSPVLSLSSLVMVRDAVRAGAGAARLPISLVSHDLSAGTMVHWGDLEGPDIALWTLYPTRRLLSARVSAFLDHLKEAFPKGTPDELAAYVER